MNQVFLIGRLTRDIDIKYTKDNIAIGNITIAVSRNRKNANGEYESDFINCVVYRETAERIEKYTHKGDLIAIGGRIQTRNYEDKDGNKKYVTEVVVERVTFLGTKKETKQEDTSDPYEEMGTQIELTDDELPF